MRRSWVLSSPGSNVLLKYLFYYITSTLNKIKVRECYLFIFYKKILIFSIAAILSIMANIFLRYFTLFVVIIFFLKLVNHSGLLVNQYNSTVFLPAEQLFEINQSQFRISNYNVLLSAPLILMEICLKGLREINYREWNNFQLFFLGKITGNHSPCGVMPCNIWKYLIRCQSEKYIINCDIIWHKKNHFKQNLY